MLDFSIDEFKKLFENTCFNRLLKFYENHKDLFVQFTPEEKNGIIKNIYEELGYTKQTRLNTDLKPGVHEAVIVFKKVSSNNMEELIRKISAFLNDDSVYEEGAFGTGIYAITGENIQEAYSSVNKGPTDIVIENILEGEVITSESIKELKEAIIRKFNSNGYDSFLRIIEDDGVFAAILGYSAIISGNTIVVLDRSKLITYDSRINADLNRLKKIG